MHPAAGSGTVFNISNLSSSFEKHTDFLQLPGKERICKPIHRRWINRVTSIYRNKNENERSEPESFSSSLDQPHNYTTSEPDHPQDPQLRLFRTQTGYPGEQDPHIYHAYLLPSAPSAFAEIGKPIDYHFSIAASWVSGFTTHRRRLTLSRIIPRLWV
jgi:hypothetical protein